MSVLRKAGDVIESLLRDSRVDVNAKDQFGVCIKLKQCCDTDGIRELLSTLRGGNRARK